MSAEDAWLTYRDEYMRSRALNPKRAASQMRKREFIAGYEAALSAAGCLRDDREAPQMREVCDCAPDCGERIACTQTGAMGHLGCGWCDIHNHARHLCLCRPVTPDGGDQ